MPCEISLLYLCRRKIVKRISNVQFQRVYTVLQTQYKSCRSCYDHSGRTDGCADGRQHNGGTSWHNTVCRSIICQHNLCDWNGLLHLLHTRSYTTRRTELRQRQLQGGYQIFSECPCTQFCIEHLCNGNHGANYAAYAVYGSGSGYSCICKIILQNNGTLHSAIHHFLYNKEFFRGHWHNQVCNVHYCMYQYTQHPPQLDTYLRQMGSAPDGCCRRSSRHFDLKGYNACKFCNTHIYSKGVQTLHRSS